MDVNSLKAMLWVDASSNEIIGLYFFEDERNKSIDIISTEYVKLAEFLLSKLHQFPGYSTRIWMQ